MKTQQGSYKARYENEAAALDAVYAALDTFRNPGELPENAINRLRARNAALLAALKPFADYFDGNLGNVGGGTVVSVPFTVQQFKEAKVAIAAAEGEEK